MNTIEEIINKIIDISEKYGFEYLSEDEYELRLEYIGDDVEYKDCDEDFEKWNDYLNFAYEMEEIVDNHFEKALKEIEKIINIEKWYHLEGEYDVVTIEYNL